MNRKLFSLILVLMMVLLSACSKNKQKDSDENIQESYATEVSVPEEYIIETQGADAYYASNADNVKSFDVHKSDDLYTEAEAVKLFTERGFDSSVVTAEYSIDGEYTEEYEIDSASSETHPMYQTYYISENGDFWTIYIINGSVFAYPVGYNLQSGLGVQLLLSETKKVTGYDNRTNQFYESIPKESALIVKKVKKIDSKTLDEMTIKELEEL